MRITDQQIAQLYKFTKQHFVEHYDVQTELVDHLANDIEEIWKEKPTLSFEQARDISFKKFGVFGFMGVVEEKQKQLGRKYRKILLTFFKEWFQLPKIVLTLLIFFTFYQLLQLKIGSYFFVVCLSVLIVLEIYQRIKLRKLMKRRFQENKKKWMLEEMIFNSAIFGSYLITLNIFNFFDALTDFEPVSKINALIFSLLITLSIIYAFITLFVIPKRANEFLEAQYPEYKFSE